MATLRHVPAKTCVCSCDGMDTFSALSSTWVIFLDEVSLTGGMFAAVPESPAEFPPRMQLPVGTPSFPGCLRMHVKLLLFGM